MYYIYLSNHYEAYYAKYLGVVFDNSLLKF